ncbi:MAG: hypothetical protein SGI87_05370 [Flavobacteriales bacterium]|nr:hypothetical protein [Flavobacteriales bacterium]
MTNRDMLNEIRNEIEKRRKELAALESAAAVLSGSGEASSVRSASAPAGKKRGRKPGQKSAYVAKSQSTAVSAPKKRGPKPKAKKARKGPAPKKGKPLAGQRVDNVNGKILDGLKAAGKMMNNSEIANGLAHYYPQKEKIQLNKYASILLNQLMHDKKVKRTNVDLQGKKLPSYYWGLPNWFDGEKPKAQYMR